VEVLLSDAAKDYVRDHGGTAFVRAHPHRCCTGTLTLLDITTAAPKDAADFQSVGTGEVEVRFCGPSIGRPHQLVIELRGGSGGIRSPTGTVAPSGCSRSQRGIRRVDQRPIAGVLPSWPHRVHHVAEREADLGITEPKGATRPEMTEG